MTLRRGRKGVYDKNWETQIRKRLADEEMELFPF